MLVDPDDFDFYYSSEDDAQHQKSKSKESTPSPILFSRDSSGGNRVKGERSGRHREVDALGGNTGSAGGGRQTRRMSRGTGMAGSSSNSTRGASPPTGVLIDLDAPDEPMVDVRHGTADVLGGGAPIPAPPRLRRTTPITRSTNTAELIDLTGPDSPPLPRTSASRRAPSQSTRAASTTNNHSVNDPDDVLYTSFLTAPTNAMSSRSTSTSSGSSARVRSSTSSRTSSRTRNNLLSGVGEESNAAGSSSGNRRVGSGRAATSAALRAVMGLDETGAAGGTGSSRSTRTRSSARDPQRLGGGRRISPDALHRARSTRNRVPSPTRPSSRSNSRTSTIRVPPNPSPTGERTLSDEDFARMLQEEEYSALQQPSLGHGYRLGGAPGGPPRGMGYGLAAMQRARQMERAARGSYLGASPDMEFLMALQGEEGWGAEELLADLIMPGHLQHAENYMDDDELDYERLLALGDRLGDVKPKGLPAATIASLPTCTFQPSSTSSRKGKTSTAAAASVVYLSGEDAKCTVCLMEYDAGEEIKGTPCMHWFHGECLDQWLKNNNSCPICRTSITGN
ncbi:uncharacterized protein EV422DRAFT_572484 [Fimicolochytrium jonesii]|uniref:uncharacterized protein n=1 Tax=Fimicolochytrium jonesii TaxID=1396493 RepID=UPI0022FDB148|nr:uncharacterized protein EV422DRAFT_572484 [Fimicolochytrium jonesii]KAI8815784.1 hypothetical protein EV422DRAFT_572484 [Fimicolochytrium jonesii]